MAYTEFDGQFGTDGQNDQFMKNWSAHVPDWNVGDPTWGQGKGKGLIGAINYLASEGQNAVSFLTMNIAGDGPTCSLISITTSGCGWTFRGSHNGR